jgi:hypothetical protein
MLEQFDRLEFRDEQDEQDEQLLANEHCELSLRHEPDDYDELMPEFEQLEQLEQLLIHLLQILNEKLDELDELLCDLDELDEQLEFQHNELIII